MCLQTARELSFYVTTKTDKNKPCSDPQSYKRRNERPSYRFDRLFLLSEPRWPVDEGPVDEFRIECEEGTRSG